MKNKLSPEEQLLHSKLNEPQFVYEEADWKQIESAVAKKGFWANYNPFFKAAALFIALGSVVLLVNQRYQPLNSSTTHQAEKETTNNKKESIKSGTVKKENISSNTTEILETTIEIPAKVDVNEPTSKNNVTTTIQVSPTTINLTESSDDSRNIVNGNKIVEEANVSTPVRLEIIEIRILNATCLREPINAELGFRGFYNEELRVFWQLNGKPITGSGPKTQFEIKKAGNYELSATVYQQETVIATKSTSFLVEDKVELDFSSQNLSDPFNDEKMLLKINQPVTGKYVWYKNRASDKLLSGTEVEWNFKKEGRHDITVEYTSNYGCFQKKIKEVDVDIFFKPEVFPNAFSPDHDGTNDELVFSVLEKYNFKSYHLLILNMNGKIVFETRNQNERWNGKANNSGEILKGNFAWNVALENEKGETKSFKGKVRIGN